MKYSLNWDLDSIFPGGIHGKALTNKIDTIQHSIQVFRDTIHNYDWQDDAPEYTNFIALVEFIQKIKAALVQAGMYVNGKYSDNIHDDEIPPLMDKIQALDMQASQAEQLLQKKLVALDDDTFAKLIVLPDLQTIAFSLKESRNFGKHLLSDEQEALISKMHLDGLSGWSSHYNTLVASVKIPFHDKDGNPITLSAGQADNEILGNDDPNYRHDLMPAWEKAWSEKQNLFADTLNHLSGSQLTDYQVHHIDDVLTYPLALNRMSKQTLDTMWQVVDENKGLMIKYLQRKAKLMGKDTIGWQDVEAPLHLSNTKRDKITYNQAAEFIMQQFKKFSPKMAQLAKRAFENRWIEAENRPGKEPGGYMQDLPETGEARIFLTFTGSPNDAATIAHELGHAFHSSVMTDLPYFRQDYAMNVAETASTLGELIVADANVQEATSDEEKISLLNDKMDNPIAMFLNIHARYLFETRYYEKRKNGTLTARQINELMLQAQKDAFDNSLDIYSPHFWASKMHFYFDDVPFYNFPYTFGYLFSLGIYAQAQKTDNFEDKYIALLRDTANMSTEDLAKKHLNIDLTQPDFWEAGVKLIKKDIDEFMRLTKKYV